MKSLMANRKSRFLFLLILENMSSTALAVSISPIVNIFDEEVAVSWLG